MQTHIIWLFKLLFFLKDLYNDRYTILIMFGLYVLIDLWYF
jgi:hypothetical protein